MKELFATRTVNYLASPTEEGQALLDELEALQAKTDPTDQDAERIAELMAETVTTTEYRFTLSRYSVEQKNMRDALAVQGRRWFKEKNGLSIDELMATPDGEEDDFYSTRINLTNQIWAWAAIVAGLDQIDTRKVDLVTGQSPDWLTMLIPLEWQEIDNFLRDVDMELLNELGRAVYALNPSLFKASQDPAKKKYGVMSKK